MQQKLSNAAAILILGGLLILLSGATGEPLSQACTLLSLF